MIGRITPARHQQTYYDAGMEGWSQLEQGALALHELFLTLRGAGFTEEQALKIVASLIANPGEENPDES